MNVEDRSQDKKVMRLSIVRSRLPQPELACIPRLAYRELEPAPQAGRFAQAKLQEECNEVRRFDSDLVRAILFLVLFSCAVVGGFFLFEILPSGQLLP
jgi:hypothetical protein